MGSTSTGSATHLFISVNTATEPKRLVQQASFSKRTATRNPCETHSQSCNNQLPRTYRDLPSSSPSVSAPLHPRKQLDRPGPPKLSLALASPRSWPVMNENELSESEDDCSRPSKSSDRSCQGSKELRQRKAGATRWSKTPLRSPLSSCTANAGINQSPSPLWCPDRSPSIPSPAFPHSCGPQRENRHGFANHPELGGLPSPKAQLRDSRYDSPLQSKTWVMVSPDFRSCSPHPSRFSC